MNKKFTGIIPALITPLEKDNKTIAENEVKKIIDMQLSQGADGFYILGGTGEGVSIGRQERELMCELAVKQVAGRKPIINHIAAINFNEAVALAKHAEKTGCDAIAAIPPLFFAYTSDDVYEYYKKLAASVNIPLIIYYHPSAIASMSAELVARIFEIDNVTGVKWSSNNFFELMKLKDMTNGEMNIINGPDELLLLGLTAGADAGIGSTYNMMLPEFLNIYNSFKEGNIAFARETQYKVNRIINLLFKYGIIPGVKFGTSLMGIVSGDARFPLNHLNEAQAKALTDELEAFGWQPNGRII